MKDLRKAGKLTDTTDAKNTKRHFDRQLRLQAKHLRDLTHKRSLHKTQTQTQLSQQRAKLPPTESFTIERVGFRYSKKFSNYFDSFKVAVNHPPVEPVDVFVQILLEVVRERGLVRGDYIRLTVDHHSWYKPFSIKKIKITDTAQNFAKIIHEFLEFVEYKSAPLNELTIEVHSQKIPRGRGRLQVTKKNLMSKLSLISIKNSDSICLARAIVTALANLNKTKWTRSQLKNGFNASRKLQTDEARKLHAEANVEPNEFGSTLEDIDTFAKHLNIQINIIDGDNFNELIYATTNDFPNGMIYLYKLNNHFDVILSMPGFLSKAYYCHDCKKTYTRRDKHKCSSKCFACFKKGKCNGSQQQCPDCNRTFFGKACFDEHKRNRATKPGKVDTVCASVQKCELCCRTITDIDGHVCGYKECSNCKEKCEASTHKCYMLRKWAKGGNCKMTPTCGDSDDVKKCNSCRTRTEKYIYWDAEATQNTGVHIPNWIHAWDHNGEEFTFTSIEDFCAFVFSDTCKDYTFIAHNSKSYDSQFVLKHCVELGLKPYVIHNGSKIMYMSVQKRIFIDSMNHVSGRLADFPKTFRLTELKKGYFPHYFNTPENQSYVGPIPDTKYYGPDYMSSKDREVFLKWYQARVDENFVFDFTKELRAYCRSDVDILRRSMMIFRSLFIEICNIDPLQYVTIASVVMTITRSEFLKPKEIAVVKDTTNQENFSKVSVKWLDYLSETTKTTIRHALNGGEYVIDEVGKVAMHGWLLQSYKYRLRVSGMFLARMSKVLQRRHTQP